MMYVGLLPFWDVLPAMQMQLQVWMTILHFYLCQPAVGAMAKPSLAEWVAELYPGILTLRK